MGIQIPAAIIEKLDFYANQLIESKLIKNYKFHIGDDNNTHCINYDDSEWTCVDHPIQLKRDQGTTWFRFNLELPEKINDIPVAGSAIRLESFFLAPTHIYVNEQLFFFEKTWMDFKNPEIILTQQAVPGEVFHIAMKLELGERCYYNGRIYIMYCAIDSVEDVIFEITSFKDELLFISRFSESDNYLPGIIDTLENFFKYEHGIPDLAKLICSCRSRLKPLESVTKQHIVHLVGHAHIDMNWFWDYSETLDVVKRDFDTLTQIMEEIPDFKFSQSQCATYEIAEKHYPEIFSKIKKFVKLGNWDITATTWVEGDMNMASGESIVRHLLYSKKYIKEHFNTDSRIIWCPDTFGHSANIPQIAKKAGIDYYFMMRCGRGNPVFWWEGLDGSKLLVFNSIYSSEINAGRAISLSNTLLDKYNCKNTLYVYGAGDHGGGPTRRDIIKAQKLNSYPTLPKFEFSTTHAFFDSIAGETTSTIPIEEGELNFIFDGCYTTHADIKKYNRECENLTAKAEAAVSMAYLLGAQYDGNTLEQCWKVTLFNQFHDILDGSGIQATYEYSSEQAENCIRTLESVIQNSIRHLMTKAAYSNNGLPVLLLNTLAWNRSEYVKIRKPAHFNVIQVIDHEEKKLSSQIVGEYVFVYVPNIPSMGYKVVYLVEQATDAVRNSIKETTDHYLVETQYYTIEIKKCSGEITTLYDKKTGKYIVQKEWTDAECRNRNGVLNTFQIHYEAPIPMSAWYIAPITATKNLISGAKSFIKEDGCEVKIINFKHSFDHSVISQDIVIYNNSPRIDFETCVEWNEYGAPEQPAPMLKVVFTPDINNRDASYEIPFGTVNRPCKDIEVPALKWVDISEDNYGFALLNNCKYGHKVRGNCMEMTLIRSGWEPDRKSDIGIHKFTYSILPHEGHWKEASVIKEGYCINNEILFSFFESCSDMSLPEALSYIELDKEHVALSTFKLSESKDALIIRVYEGAGLESAVQVNLGFNIETVEEVDLLENEVYTAVPCCDNSFSFYITKFEIKTFKLYLREKAI